MLPGPRVPQDDGRRDQVQATGPVALLLEGPVADLAQTVEDHGAGQRIACLPLVQPGVDAVAQIHALQPLQDEQRALDAAELAQRDRQAVLPGEPMDSGVGAGLAYFAIRFLRRPLQGHAVDRVNDTQGVVSVAWPCCW